MSLSGFHISGTDARRGNIESGPKALGAPANEESDADPRPRAATNRKHKKISHGEVKQSDAQKAERGQQTINDSEAMGEMT